MFCKKTLGLATLLTVVGLMFASNALAAPASTTLLHRCGGPANTPAQLVGNWDNMGVTGSAGRFYGINPVNDTVGNYAKTRFSVGILAKDATIKNEGCSGGSLGNAGNKHLGRGTKVFYDHTALNAKYPQGWSHVAKKGYRPIQAVVPFAAQTTCSNPGKNFVVVTIWIKIPVKLTTKKPVTPKPKQPAVPTPVCYHGTTPVYVMQTGEVLGPNQQCIAQSQPVQPCNGITDNSGNCQGQGQQQGQQQGNNNCIGAGACGIVVITTPAPAPPVVVTAPMPPSIGSITHPQELYRTTDPQNPETTPLCANGVISKPGDDILVTFTLPGMGSWQGGINTVEYTSTGSDNNKCVTLVSPTEDGTVTVTAVAVDKTIGAVSQTTPPVSVSIVDPPAQTNR